MDNYKIKIFLLFLLFLVFSCNNHETKSFYEYSMKENDVWRLPIVEPYEMYTAYCCSDWFIESSSPLGKRFGIKQKVDSINFTNNKLIIYDNNEFNNKWILLNFDNDVVVKFESRIDLSNYLNLDTIKLKLFNTETVFNNWRKTDNLPWQKTTHSI